MVNIHTVGAGGGSIAYIEGGGIRVGPKSAGSNPGPACYGNGGTKPTVTDANVVLGRIDPDNFLGGDLKLDKVAAYQAVKTIADQIGLSVEETAEGICDIANAKMADAIRNLTVKRGIDPREFTIVAFGGAGPMHAVLIADLLDVKNILVPNVSGTFSAWGMLQTDIRFDTVRNYVSLLSKVKKTEMQSLYNEMQEECISMLNQQHISTGKIRFQKSVDIRYVGQEYTVNIVNDKDSLIELEERFHESHFDIYGHNNPNGNTEIVNIRTTALGDLEKIEITKDNNSSDAFIEADHTREIVWNGQVIMTGVYSTSDLTPGNHFMGPAVIEDKNSTIVVPPNFSISIDENHNIKITKITIKEVELV